MHRQDDVLQAALIVFRSRARYPVLNGHSCSRMSSELVFGVVDSYRTVSLYLQSNLPVSIPPGALQSMLRIRERRSGE